MAYASSSKLIRWWRQRQVVPIWGRFVSGGCSSSITSFSSSTGQTNHQILPAKSFSTTAETLVSPSFSGLSSLPEIMKLGMYGNHREIKPKFSSVNEEREEKALYEVIDSLVIKSKFKKALLVFDMVLKQQKEKQKHLPVIPTSNCTSSHLDHFSNFLRYLCNYNRIDIALHQFCRMNHPNSSCRPDITTLEMTIFTLCYKDTEMVDEGVMLFDQLFEQLKQHATPSSFDRHFYATVLPFLVKANEPYKVRQLFTMIKDSDLSPHDIDGSGYARGALYDLYFDTISAFCYLWRVEEAAQFVMDHPYVECYEYMLTLYSNFGMFEEASDFLDKLFTKGAEVDYFHWAILIKRLCLEGEIVKAFRALKHMFFWWNQQHVHNCDDPACIRQTSTHDDGLLVPCSKACPALADTLLSTLACFKDGSFSLAGYTMFVSGVWKEGLQETLVEQVPSVTYSTNPTWLGDTNDFLKKMIQKGAGDIDSYDLLIRGATDEGEILKAFTTLKRSITSWVQEHASVRANQPCTHHTSSSDGLAPISQAYPCLSDMIITSSAHRGTSEGGDVFLGLAVYTMLTTGLWKDGHGCDVGEVGRNSAKQVPDLSDGSQPVK